MSRDFTNRVCFIFFLIITFSYRLLHALYVLPWLFGDKSVKSANIKLSITILSSTDHARLACPLPSREVATLSSFICAQIFFNMNWIYNVQAFIWLSMSFFSAISGLHLPLRKRMAKESKVVIYLLPGLAITRRNTRINWDEHTKSATANW